MQPTIPASQSIEEPPPFLTSWKRVYAAVIVYLILLITLLYAVTRYFTY
jgi:hypothetical protein